MKTRRHLSSEERDKITILQGEGLGIRKIAKELGRSPSTICRELKRPQAVYYRGKYIGSQTDNNVRRKWSACHKRNNKYLRFVLLKKLDRKEHTNFVYYNAASVDWGAYGLSSNFEPDFIIAKYETNRGTFYSYRCTITDKDALANARAHLAGKVLEVYQDVIDAEIRKSKEQEK